MSRLLGASRLPLAARLKPGTGTFVVAITLVVLGFYLIYPVVLIFIMSFNMARDVLVGPAVWGLGNWGTAFQHPLLLESLLNSFLIWFLVAGIAFPFAITISLILARTKIPFTHGLEFGFWVAYMFPSLATTIGWMMLLDPDVGFVNQALEFLPFGRPNQYCRRVRGGREVVWRPHSPERKHGLWPAQSPLTSTPFPDLPRRRDIGRA